MLDWGELEAPGPDHVVVEGVEVRRGSHVRLRPRPGGDIFDLALAGRLATVDAIECDMEGTLHVAVTVDDDPGADLGAQRQPGHRFFFAPAEVEPLPQRRVLVAGIGNVFLGDDGWGVSLAELLAARALPPGVQVVDYGIRGMDLAYAMGEGWDVVVLLDIAPRGEPPGTLSVIEAEIEDGHVGLETHGMDPVKVMATARALGGEPPRTLVVACEPLTRMTGEEEELVGELSAPVRAALEPAVALVEQLLAELTSPDPKEEASQ